MYKLRLIGYAFVIILTALISGCIETSGELPQTVELDDRGSYYSTGQYCYIDMRPDLKEWEQVESLSACMFAAQDVYGRILNDSDLNND